MHHLHFVCKPQENHKENVIQTKITLSKVQVDLYPKSHVKLRLLLSIHLPLSLSMCTFVGNIIKHQKSLSHSLFQSTLFIGKIIKIQSY